MEGKDEEGEADAVVRDGKEEKKETSHAGRRKNGFNEKLMRF